MLAGVVAAGMFNDGNVNPGRLKAPTVMLAGVVAAGPGRHHTSQHHRKRLSVASAEYSFRSHSAGDGPAHYGGCF